MRDARCVRRGSTERLQGPFPFDDARGADGRDWPGPRHQEVAIPETDWLSFHEGVTMHALIRHSDGLHCARGPDIASVCFCLKRCLTTITAPFQKVLVMQSGGSASGPGTTLSKPISVRRAS
ncbi:hypothetical protein G7Y89_g13454 [Cudoniella acicularis]|uniref:Uncharacterized protein n=1 Tax=Cudoniella acicularis TaxID=354080 RepID=A0A8H4R882_9HELO|nr:hypothetical protein G7Y89_g13454 [Cudoniella acicularis]